jgi:hypothetical protein
MWEHHRLACPKFLFSREKTATPMIATAMVIFRDLSGILSNSNAPKPEPMIVRATKAGKRLRLRTPLAMNGIEPPTLIKVKASMFVATATWASMPRAIITGTVIKDVLPVTTLITLVKKNTAIKTESLAPDTRP